MPGLQALSGIREKREGIIFVCKRLKISDFTKPELDHIESLANFTPEQLTFFKLRAKGKSIIEISLSMSVSESKANNLSACVTRKIYRVFEWTSKR